MDLRPFYFVALDNLGRLFAGTQASQLSATTPCDAWNVRALMEHIVGGTDMYARALGGEAFSAMPSGPEVLGEDPTSSLEAARKTAVDTWNDDGVLERTVVIPAGEMPGSLALRIALVEAVVHGWDLAKATGQEHGIEPMVAAAMLDGLRRSVTPELRGTVFEEEVTVSDDAPVEEQLVAFLGRTP